MRPLGAISVLVVCAALLGACNERTNPQEILVYNPGGDAGADAGGFDAGDVGRGDECEVPEGSTCRLPRAFGVCLSGRCSLVACVSGFTDCDGDRLNGCEVAVDSEDSCGACGVACEEGQQCQLGLNSYVCAAEPVCRPGSFDLDLELRNGCEWVSSWEPGRSSPTLGYTPEIVFERAPGEVWTAGRVGELPHLARLAEAAVPLESAPVTTAAPVRIDADDDLLFVGWEDGVTTYDISSGDELYAPTACTTGQGVSDLAVSAVGPIVATDHSLVRWQRNPTCVDCSISGSRFGAEDYLAALWPGNHADAFAPEEVAACTPCSFDAASGDPVADAACHPDDCRPDGAPSGCETCNPVGCPTFDVVRVLVNKLSERVYVVTRRGLIAFAFRAGWKIDARLEAPFDPDVVSGLAFVDGAIDSPIDSDGDLDRITLLDTSGRILTVTIERRGSVQPGTPSISVGSGRQLALSGTARLVQGSSDDFLVGTNGPSAAITRLTAEDGPGIAGLELGVAASTSTGFLLLYTAAGLTFERRIERR